MKQGICDIFFTSVTTGQYTKKNVPWHILALPRGCFSSQTTFSAACASQDRRSFLNFREGLSRISVTRSFLKFKKTSSGNFQSWSKNIFFTGRQGMPCVPSHWPPVLRRCRTERSFRSPLHMHGQKLPGIYLHSAQLTERLCHPC